MNYVLPLNLQGTDFGTNRTITFRPGKLGSIKITKPLVSAPGSQMKWDAWSRWNNDVGDGNSPVVGQTWNNGFSVWGSNDGEDFVKIWDAWEEGVDPDYYTTAALAYAALNALLPLIFDGYDTYQIRNHFDENPPDNRGGLSLLVEMAMGSLAFDLLPHLPDAPIKEEWTWLTDTQVSYSGTEDPTPLNHLPKRTFSGGYSFDAISDLRRYQATMQRAFRGVFRVPLFQYQVKAKATIPYLSQVVMCNTIRSDFRANGEAMIREGNTFELVVIDEVQSDRLILGTSTVNAYSARALITPVTQVFSATGAQLNRVNPDHSGTASYTFKEFHPWDPFVNPDADETITMFDAMPVLDKRAIGDQFEAQFDSGISITDEYIGLPDVMNPWTQGQWAFPLRWQCNRILDVEDWLWWQEFCNTIQGANLNFLLPTFRSDLDIVTPASGSGNAVTFKGHDFRDHYYGLDTFSRLVIESAAGRQFVKVTGVTNVSGNDRVTFTPALPAGTWSTDQKIGFLLKVRNADDKVTCDHYGLHTDVSMSVRTVK